MGNSTAISLDRWLDLELHLRAGAAWTGAAEPQLTAAAVDGDQVAALVILHLCMRLVISILNTVARIAIIIVVVYITNFTIVDHYRQSLR